MPQFKWDILNYGRLLNNVRLQDARTQELVATYQNRVLTAAREVQTALRGFLRSQEQAADLGRSVTAATAATRVEEQLYYDIKADVNRLFTLESNQVQEQDNLAVAQGNMRIGPAGGWCPYGGGLLRWWGPHCFPRCGAPDDYCRKPLPRTCWPPYPPYYFRGPPRECCPPDGCRPTVGGPR